MNDVTIYEKDGQLWTTSRDVAEVLGKNHFDVLDRIKNLDCSQEFRARNFAVSSYTSKQNKEVEMFEMTRDGWTFLVMGFTGKKAARFKEKYIELFNKMEAYIKKQNSASDRHMLVFEKFSREMAEMKKESLELMRVNQEIMKGISSSVSTVGERVDGCEKKIDTLDAKVETLSTLIPINRKSLSKNDMRKHINCVADCFFGRCPLCGNTQIVDGFRQKTEELTFDHHFNRHEAALDKTWPICKKCNLDRSNGKVPDIDSRRFFDGYQARLKYWIAKMPQQLQLKDC